ncbi:DUF2946 family protein [Bradyrhizobium liaoningense]|uniref:DUF2946 family protein n=1 Tax=Bradyrhizobium liaoningense TaxID=43992 RepID=UPI001BACA091|nr:DUF2946 family protein [Bradyrhizobium liaoningense]MBR0716886.1 hypothetical protein [Bradyrhizobium liaoningense]
MTVRALFKHSMAGLVMLGVLLQACLVVLQLAVLAQPARADTAFTVICSTHGAVALDTTDAPDDHWPDCVLCPLCAHSGVAGLAIPAIVANVIAFAIAPAWVPTIASGDRSSLALGLPPPGRGPPV